MTEIQTTLQTDLNVEMELNMIDASFKELRSDLSSLRLNIETIKEDIRTLFDCLENSQREFDLEHNKRVDGLSDSVSRDLDLMEADAEINHRIDDLLHRTEMLDIKFSRFNCP